MTQERPDYRERRARFEAALDRPATYWIALKAADEAITAGATTPDAAQFAAARALPPGTSLRQYLLCLGMDPAALADWMAAGEEAA